MFTLSIAQGFMHRHGIDAWLIYNFREQNPVMNALLGFKTSTTRRSFFCIPKSGQPVLLAHKIDQEQFAAIENAAIQYFTSWKEMQEKLKKILAAANVIAMEYSPGGALPAASWVDAGTIEMIRSFGIDVVSSENLFQVAAAQWSTDAKASHERAVAHVSEIKDQAFAFIREKIRAHEPLTEYDVQQYILNEFKKRNLETEDTPIVAVNANSGNPHYEPSAAIHSPIKKGDWVLIDLWAREPGEQNVFGDITWVGYVGNDVPVLQQTVFDSVKEARDAAVAALKAAWEKNEPMHGWQLDDAARTVITNAGYGTAFIHRTGHSIGPGPSVHALGMNLDNLETHDTRQAVPGIGFSVEPGIYLEDFGVRLEINMYIDPEQGPLVTTPVQNTIVLLG